MKIAKAELFTLDLPFKVPFAVSYQTYYSMPTIIVKLTTEDGTVGYGEATPDQHVTGETLESTTAVLQHTLLPSVLGFSPFDIESIHMHMNEQVKFVPAAKAAIDIACYDLMGKLSGQPVYNLLGGQYRKEIDIPYVISIGNADDTAAEARKALHEGFHSLKLKTGPDLKQSIESIRAVKEAAGSHIPLRVDANQGWGTVSNTFHVLRQIEGIDIDWIEQPVYADDMDALAEVKSRSSFSIMADEAIKDSKDLRLAIQKKAADYINIKLMKCGGIYPAVKLAAQAEMEGLICQIGSMVESSVGSAAGLHVTMAKANIQSCELVGPLMLSDDIGNLSYKLPFAQLSEQPGLGIEVDIKKVHRLAANHIVIQ
ncbi:MAG TPA: dipeptide epimerase [Bacillus sp. (in: firmicutes)]|nr:dipeptide epimerase [Bacillus sp. (in: firmicutes)]